MKYVTVYITAKDVKEARKISRILVDEKLAASINIIPKIESMYNWKGKFQNHPEALIIGKSKSNLQAKIIKTVKKHHSYTIPCINFLPIIRGNPDYLNWLEKETKEK